MFDPPMRDWDVAHFSLSLTQATSIRVSALHKAGGGACFLGFRLGGLSLFHFCVGGCWFSFCDQDNGVVPASWREKVKGFNLLCGLF